jgi:hypothetical protein
VTAARRQRTTVVVREGLIVGVVVFLSFLVRGLVDAKCDLAFDHAEHVIDAEQTWGVFAGGALAMLGYVVATQ